MNENTAFILSVTVLVLFFVGDPDLMDAVIAWLSK